MGAGRDGLYRFEQDVMRWRPAGAGPPSGEWKKALAERLPAYLPGRMSAPVRSAWSWRGRTVAGSIYLQKMSRLGQLEELGGPGPEVSPP
ncbi:MAG: hypothetical protein ACLT8E_05560 [Akkermansia sp.]